MTVVVIARRAVGVPCSVLPPLCLFTSAATIYLKTCHLTLTQATVTSHWDLSSLLTGPPALSFASSRSLFTQQPERALKKLIRDYKHDFPCRLE